MPILETLMIFKIMIISGLFYQLCVKYAIDALAIGKSSTVEPLYNEVLGTMKITLLYQVSHCIWVKKLINI